MMIKGHLLLWSRIVMSTKGPSLLRSGIEWRSKVLFYFNLDSWNVDQRSSSTSIWNCNVDQRSFFTLIWSCNDDQSSSSTSIWIVEMMIKGLLLLWSRIVMSIKGPPLLRSGIKWRSKVLFYFDLDSWNVDQRSSSTSIWICNVN